MTLTDEKQYDSKSNSTDDLKTLSKDAEPALPEKEVNTLPSVEAVPITGLALSITEKNEETSKTLDNALKASGSMFVQITAPSDLPEGYQLEVNLPRLNHNAKVTIPQGGVTAGQVFEAEISNSSQLEIHAAIPVGKWKDEICNCFTHGFFHPMLWNACCLPLAALGQVMTRFNLDIFADPSESNISASKTFQIALCIQIIVIVVYNILSFFEIFFISEPILLAYAIFVTVIMTKTRLMIRKKYSIPGSTFEDCCCTFWCTCCTVAQMARHTADYEKYGGQCCSSTGLSPDTPLIV